MGGSVLLPVETIDEDRGMVVPMKKDQWLPPQDYE